MINVSGLPFPTLINKLKVRKFIIRLEDLLNLILRNLNILNYLRTSQKQMTLNVSGLANNVYLAINRDI